MMQRPKPSKKLTALARAWMLLVIVTISAQSAHAQTVTVTGNIPYAKNLKSSGELNVWTMTQVRDDKDKTVNPKNENLAKQTIKQKDSQSLIDLLGDSSPSAPETKNYSGTLDMRSAVLPATVAILVDDYAMLTVTETGGRAEGVNGPVFSETYEVKGTALWDTRSYLEFPKPLPPGRIYKLDLIYKNTANLTPQYQGKVDVDGVSVYVCLLPFEVNVDADNTTVEGYPDTSKGDLGAAERAAQFSDDEERYPGVRVMENAIDSNDDGVVGYADGIDKFGNGKANACWKFEPMLIRSPLIERLPNAKFVFKYSCSDPDQMTCDRSGQLPRFNLPVGKILRLWKKDGDAVRKPQSAHEGGHFIRADQEYTPQDLGWKQGDLSIRLYIEAVETTVFDRSTPVEVEFYPDGTGHPESVAKDRFKVRPCHMFTENPGLP